MSLPDDLRDALAKYVDGLSEPEEGVVKLLLGFGIRRPLSMSEVAAQMDLPEAEVDRMHRRDVLLLAPTGQLSDVDE